MHIQEFLSFKYYLYSQSNTQKYSWQFCCNKENNQIQYVCHFKATLMPSLRLENEDKGVSEKHLFKTIESPTKQALAWGLVWKDSKGFLISTKFRGASSQFSFWAVLHSRFSLSPLSARPYEGRVKIYNVKQVKTEMVRSNPKLCRNQKSLWILSN